MLQNYTIWHIASVFFKEPTTRYYLMGISRRLKIAHTSVKRDLTKLAKEGIIIKEVERRGSRDFPHYRANLEGKSYRHYKRLYNLDSVRQLAEHLADTLQPDVIILFGSYQKAEDIEDSDIDLYLQCDEVDIDLSRYERDLGRRIQLHFSARFENFPATLQENLKSGVVLHGSLRCESRSSETMPRQKRSG